jgi:hypothetical protein
MAILIHECDVRPNGANVIGCADALYHLCTGDRFAAGAGAAYDDDDGDNASDTNDEWTAVDEVIGEVVPSVDQSFQLAERLDDGAGGIEEDHLPVFSDGVVFATYVEYEAGHPTGLAAGEYSIDHDTGTVYTGSTLNGGTVDYCVARVLKCPAADTNHNEDYYLRILECEDQELITFRGYSAWNSTTHQGTQGSIPYGKTGGTWGPALEVYTDGAQVSDDDPVDLWVHIVRQGGTWPRILVAGEGDSGVSGVQNFFVFEELNTTDAGDTTGAVVIGPAYQAGSSYLFEAREDPQSGLGWDDSGTDKWLRALTFYNAPYGPTWGLARVVSKVLRYPIYLFTALQSSGSQGIRGNLEGVELTWSGGWVNKDYAQDGADVRRLYLANTRTFSSSNGGKYIIALEE